MWRHLEQPSDSALWELRCCNAFIDVVYVCLHCVCVSSTAAVIVSVHVLFAS